MLLAKGDLELVAMSPTATWPLGSCVNKGDREGSHGAHLNLRTVTTTCVVAHPLTSLVTVHRCRSSVGLVGWLAVRRCHSSVGLARWLAVCGRCVCWAGEVARWPSSSFVHWTGEVARCLL